jgi:hypothetical protein
LVLYLFGVCYTPGPHWLKKRLAGLRLAAHDPGANVKGQNHEGVMGQNPQLCIYIYQWIGLRENLQETIDYPIKYGAFL